MDYEKLLEHAKDFINKELEPGTIFEVKQLFNGTVWEALEKGDKVGFGRYFSSAIKKGRIKNVIRLERAKNNHARYQKLEK